VQATRWGPAVGGPVIVRMSLKNKISMAQIIALAVAVLICFALFGKEVTKLNVNPLIIILLAFALVMLMHQDGNTVQLGELVWSSHWLPQMLAIIIVFLLIMVPGPRLSALIKAEKSAGFKTLTSAVIGILVCVLVGMIAVMAASQKFAIPLLLNR
jgi:hypothetical protein